MGRKLYLPLVVFILFGLTAFAQSGEIRGKVTEKEGSKEPVPFASVVVLNGNNIVTSSQTDFDGNYSIKPITPGTYDVKVTVVGYQPVMTKGVVVSFDKMTFVNFTISKGLTLKEIEVTDYKVPVIDKGDTKTATTITREDIQQAPNRDVKTIASTQAGVYQKDDGGDVNIRGSRSDGTQYIVDGQKVRGGANLAKNGTEQITVITGGIPASIGDATGGVISVTTRGPSNELGGGLELATSTLLDDYGYNLASFDITGPILMARDSAGNKTDQSIAGFFIAGEYQYDKDPSPPSIDVYKVKDEILGDIRQNPLVRAPGGVNYIHRSHYFTYDSLTTQSYRENVASRALRMNAKIDIQPVKNVNITLGGSIEDTRGHDYTDIYSLMNYDQNNQRLSTNWRAFAKIRQKFTSEGKESAASVIKNAYYTIQADYSNEHTVLQNDVHKDRLFDYGYVGNFKASSIPLYQFTPNLAGDTMVMEQVAVLDTHVVFVPGTQNPYTSNYTSQYYDLTDPFGTSVYQSTLFNIPALGGLINGDNRVGLNVYGIWATPGRVRTGYSISDNSQVRVSASGSADIGKHNIQIGLEYEQRTDRGYSVAPNSLWTIMRQLANQKITGFDKSNPNTTYFTSGGVTYVNTSYADGAYSPTYLDENDHSKGTITGFYEEIRTLLGISVHDTVQVDAYDPSTFNLGQFSPDELLNSGNPVVNYYGFDYTGNMQTGNASWDLNDFYVNRDDKNNLLRKVDAFRPTYLAGYIEDKFTYNDIIFNIGVRVDRFDANQKVLKDGYSLYEVHKAGDVNSSNFSNADVPSSIGNDFAVYVNNSEAPTEILGYRSGNQWYSKAGVPITDLSSLLLTSTGGIQPWLTNYSDYKNNTVNPNAFEDYTPQVNVMPRIAFSFPISDEAYFQAHYDILTQRPQDGSLVRFNPITYYTWSQGIGGTFENPNLKPESTTDYEINFKQKLSKSSAFSIAAFYRELRNMVQITSLDYAFPVKYNTYGNIDFGTVKGLTFGYDLRRTSNVRMNISYTLQFADCTGSDPNTSSGILSQAGQTNLREIKPLSFDQRHTFVTSIDFRYESGTKYNGPVLFNKQIFANAGLNLVFRAGSGTPYTRKSNITPTADFTTTANSRSVIAGTLNGSRYPWQFKIDAKIDKDFTLSFGKKAEGKEPKEITCNVYLQVLNVLNTQNVSAVYAATGSPSDDGYIDSPGAQTSIAQKVSPQAYVDLYRIAVNNASNYSLPRRIHLGVMINF
ncbi:MAG: TonB-dependent receptor [Bacteroidetes bacterium]|nr:TonB-dependent receptor [Bacteroidota bacterium]